MKRREVVALMEALEQTQKATKAAGVSETARSEARWIIDIVATVSNRPRSEISPGTRLADLGFDSLMFVELATAIENAGGTISAPERFNEVQDVQELMSVVSPRSSTASRTEERIRIEERQADDEIYVPSFVRVAGNVAGDALQRLFYDKFLKTRYEGQSNIPVHTNFIVAPNHSSHLDMGLTKMALGEAGKDLGGAGCRGLLLRQQIQACGDGELHKPGPNRAHRLTETIVASRAFVS